MSKQNELFRRETSLPYYNDTSDDGAEDIWDDSKLNDAYDKALKIANIEVAKRVAMSTNSQPKNKDAHAEGKKGKSKSSIKNNKKNGNVKWKASMPCRAAFEGDGQEYEAVILRVINEDECLVRFLGYGDSEIVYLNSLKPSLGPEEQNRQIEEALDDKTDEAYTSQSPTTEKMDCASDRVASPSFTGPFKVKKSTKKKKQPNLRGGYSFEIPQMPFPMPNMASLRNFGSMDMPLPPPPPLALSGDRQDSEDQAISSMLLSWYMSGYYTGLYQGLKRSKENRRNV